MKKFLLTLSVVAAANQLFAQRLGVITELFATFGTGQATATSGSASGYSLGSKFMYESDFFYINAGAEVVHISKGDPVITKGIVDPAYNDIPTTFPMLLLGGGFRKDIAKLKLRAGADLAPYIPINGEGESFGLMINPQIALMFMINKNVGLGVLGKVNYSVTDNLRLYSVGLIGRF